MAKYTVNHKCGHSRVVILYGKIDDRLRKVEWMETTICPECQKAIDREQALKRAAELNLPELKGSEKQIAWAMTIRDKMLDKTNSIKDTVVKGIEAFRAMSEEDRAKYYEVKVLPDYVDMSLHCAFEASASWFIDHRSYVYGENWWIYG